MNLCNEREHEHNDNETDGSDRQDIECVTETLGALVLDSNTNSNSNTTPSPSPSLNTPLHTILSQKTIHRRGADMTLLECWNEFVTDYSHYFIDDEAPVIVLPPSMGGGADVSLVGNCM